MSVTHATTATGTDAGNGSIHKAEWNAAHTVSIAESDLSLSDVTTANVSTTKHGLAPKGDGNAAHFLNGNGAYSTPSPTVTESNLSFSDVTTANASTSAHGLLLKLDNISTHFLNGQGAWATPTGGGGGVAVATAQGTGSGDYTTSSTSYVDVDGTNLVITPTNAQSGDVLEIMAMFGGASGAAVNTAITFGIAGTDVGDTLGLAIWTNSTPNVYMTIFYHYTMPSATQPTIKLRWNTASSTASMFNRSAVNRPRMVVKNLSRNGTL